MTTYLEIAVNVPQVSGTFTYHLPTELERQVDIGFLVTIPFGRQTVQGVVLALVDDPTVPKTKPILEVLDPEPVVTRPQIELAKYLSEISLTPLAACIALMLPPGLSQTADTLYQFTEAGKRLAASVERGDESEENDQAQSTIGTPKLTEAQKRFMRLLAERGPLRGRQIERALPRRNWKATVGALKRKGLVTSEPVLQEPKVRPKTVRTAQLACSPAEVEAQMDSLSRAGTPALARRQKIMRFLIQEGGPVEVPWIYAESGGKLSDLKRLEKMGLLFLGEGEVIRDPLEKLEFVTATPPPLTREQMKVWTQVLQGLEDTVQGETVRPYLLYGVTGSGKTEIYLRAVEYALQQGKQAIVLVPEIALTPQTVRRFVARFSDQVGLIHSRLSPGERYDTWRRARAGLISLVVGPRSALFTPFANLGLIVIDESHDQSYYQSESAPSYNARELAAAYARQIKAVCLAGSATPDVTTTFRAAHGDWQALSLPDRILAHKEAVRAQMEQIDAPRIAMESKYHPLEADAETTELPPVNIIDMRAELQAGNRSIFSRALQAELNRILEHGQQGILFLNRRGMATYVFCRDCGYALKCPRCDIPLTYHTKSRRRSNALICHRCGYTRNMPGKCPDCGSTRIKQFGTGTERVEAEVHELFPAARTLRWDWETTRQKGSHDAILSQFTKHQADVLIGTQMLAKGLDLPLVTMVGAVLADVGLQLPDYRAAERSFQILTQVAGRAGRSPLGGQVILQTFQPEHYVIQHAAEHDYRGFYKMELEYRRRLGYPPFARLVRLEFRGRDETQMEQTAQNLAQQIQGWIAQSGQHATEIIGPVPCFFSRVSGNYRWQIVLRGPDPVSVLHGQNLSKVRVEVDPPSLL
jgi:primosomal protein N' (replication factor Y)